MAENRKEPDETLGVSEGGASIHIQEDIGVAFSTAPDPQRIQLLSHVPYFKPIPSILVSCYIGFIGESASVM